MNGKTDCNYQSRCPYVVSRSTSVFFAMFQRQYCQEGPRLCEIHKTYDQAIEPPRGMRPDGAVSAGCRAPGIGSTRSIAGTRE